MKRFIMFVLIIGVVLVGCDQDEANNNNEKNESLPNTPREALTKLHLKEGFAEVIKIYETIEISEGRVISVYKGILDGEEDVYVANTEKSDNVWLVTDATNIGLPSVERLHQSSITEKFEAGYTVGEIMSNDKMKIIEIDDNDINIWVDVY